MSLLSETIEVMAWRHKAPADVLWVGTADGQYKTTWEKFAVMADAIEYDSGYGIEEINQGLVVVGEDWWLVRMEYDGSEWWSFQTRPRLRRGAKRLTAEMLTTSFYKRHR